MSQQNRHLNQSAVPAQVRTQPPQVLKELLQQAGVRINGAAPWDIQVQDPELYRRVLTHGSLGFGETYTDGLWDAQSLDQLFHRLLRADLGRKLTGKARMRMGFEAVRQSVFNLQSCTRAFQVAEAHYDIGNDVFEAMLDSTMTYSCAYWAQADNLEQAQRDKLDLICRKLQLQPGERLLDIGCGWGGLAYHAATHYGVEVVGVTVSREQQKLARERCRGLPISIELQDYRSLQGAFDKIVSVGMFEHVGPRNYDVYFETADRLLKPHGLFLLHTIGALDSFRAADPWLDKYIFPNGKLPAAWDITRPLQGHFLVEDWHNFGQDYDRTLMAWWDNFQSAWPRLQHRYDRRFYRMWKYYLMCCAGFFRARRGQLWQLVLAKPSREAVYRSVR